MIFLGFELYCKAIINMQKEMATHAIFLPGESHGQRILVGCGPRGRKGSDTMK